MIERAPGLEITQVWSGPKKDGGHNTIRREICIQFDIPIRQDNHVINTTAVYFSEK